MWRSFNVHGQMPDDSLILAETHSLLYLVLNVVYE